MYLNLLTLHLLMVLLYQIVRWQHWSEPVEQREAAAESYKFCLEVDVAACGRSLSLPPASRGVALEPPGMTAMGLPLSGYHRTRCGPYS